MRRIISAIALGAILFALTGCGGGGEKGKNKDKDVPKAASTTSG